MKTICLIGPKGVGKSTTARCFAQAHPDWQAADTDDLMLAQHEHVTGERCTDNPTLYRQLGDVAFRELESEVIANLTFNAPTILATGGGSLLNPDNTARLKKLGTLVWLDIAFEDWIHRERLTLPAEKSHNDGEQSYRFYYEKRQPLYEKAADLRLDVTGMTSAQICRTLYERVVV